MYALWCEFDIGQDGLIFTTEEDARDWIYNNDLISEIMYGGEECYTADLLFSEGLASITKLNIIGE